ncbi:MAG: hypothetical protein JNK40_02955 [Chromatiales bacterium]|nr:hypothetical protein [Chromatiales bacterium]
MVQDDYFPRALGPVTRILAGLLALASVWAVLGTLGVIESTGTGSHGIPWLSLALLPLGVGAATLFARGALTGFDPQPSAPAPEPATDAQLDRLRWLGAQVPRPLSRHQARRMIAAIESRLPATPAQQLALARYGSPRGVFTRASAERFLRDRAAEELFYRQHDWAADWYEAGVEIRAPEELDPDEMEAFDAAYGALASRGLRYPLPAYIWSWKLGEQVARMRIAGNFFDDAGSLQPQLVAAGVLRRELDGSELRQVFPAYVSLLSQVGEDYLVEIGESLAEVRTVFLAALHAVRPVLLLDTAQGWEAAAELRREVAAEAGLRAADAAIEWDEDWEA